MAAALGCALGASAARADIYTWTDAQGRVNISNLTPPDGVRVISVVREIPKPPPSDPPVNATPPPNVQALAERVRQLEWEADLARRQPPTVVYAAAPPQPQPIVQYPYAAEPAPAPSYGYAPSYAYGYGCDPSSIGCGFGWSPFFTYPSSVVVLRSPRFHRSGAFHGMNRPGFPQPIRPPPTRPPPGRSPGMRAR